MSRSDNRPAKSDAQRARDTRKRWKLRRRVAPTLVEVGRLDLWDEHNRIAIGRALDQLILDWVAAVASDGFDPVPRNETWKQRVDEHIDTVTSDGVDPVPRAKIMKV